MKSPLYQNSVCQQKDCHERAVYRYTWPGQEESCVCEQCSEKLKRVAGVIGLPLQLIPLEEE